MSPLAAGLLVGGTVLRVLGQYRANEDQADAEERNASFYREEAEFARKAGDRQRLIFDRESVVLFGKQEAAFAKGGGSDSDLKFLAQQRIFRDQESIAIQDEADFNVRLATLRAEHSLETARSLRDPKTNLLQAGGAILPALSSII